MEETHKVNNNLSNYFSNPKSFTLKKWLSQIIGQRFQSHENIIERVSSVLVTDSDLKEFGSLITEIYDSAYRKSISDYREEASKLGIKVNVVD